MDQNIQTPDLDLLAKMDACRDGIDFVRSCKGSIEAAWTSCKRSDWMCWFLANLNADDKRLRQLACRFVRETPLADGRKVWDLLTDERSRNAVVVAERFAAGEATREELDAARDAARAAAWDAAGDAAWDAAGDAAGDAARAAARDAARAAAGDAARAAQCMIIRDIFPWTAVSQLIANRKAK